jgi:hypothetical protein
LVLFVIVVTQSYSPFFGFQGFGEITDEDLQILVETGDVDGDGKISLDDFRGMIDFKYVTDFCVYITKYTRTILLTFFSAVNIGIHKRKTKKKPSWFLGMNRCVCAIV